MAQVINPEVKEDDSIQKLATGLQIYSSVQDIRARKNDKTSMSSSNALLDDHMKAMERRLKKTNTDGAYYGSGD
jgi:hypothetical protein